MSAYPPHEPVAGPAGGWGLEDWSADSRWVACSGGLAGWDYIAIHGMPSAANPVIDLGQGFPCGWDPQGRYYYIRWSGADSRYDPFEGLYWG